MHFVVGVFAPPFGTVVSAHCRPFSMALGGTCAFPYSQVLSLCFSLFFFFFSLFFSALFSVFLSMPWEAWGCVAFSEGVGSVRYVHCELWYGFGSVVACDGVVAVGWGPGAVVVGSWVMCRWCCELGVVAWRTAHFGPLWSVQRHAGPYSFGALQAYVLCPFLGTGTRVCLLGGGRVEVSEVSGVRGKAVLCSVD